MSPPRELLLPTPLPRLLALALFDWAAIAGCWTALWVGPWWAAIALWPLVGGRLHALGVVLHELAHAGRQPGALAVVVEALSGWPVCTSVEAMRAHHLRHHARTNQASDPYFCTGCTTCTRPRGWCTCARSTAGTARRACCDEGQ